MQKVKPIIKVLRTIQKSIEVKEKEDKLFSGQKRVQRSTEFQWIFLFTQKVVLKA
jgi:hypothetical protein